MVMDPAAGFLDGEDLQSKEHGASSSTMHRRFGVDEYLTSNSNVVENVPGYQETGREHTIPNSNQFLTPNSQRPPSATPSRMSSANPGLDGSDQMERFSERERSSQQGDRPDEHSVFRDNIAENHRTESRDRKTRELIRFRFDIPSEDVWYPMALALDMNVSGVPNGTCHQSIHITFVIGNARQAGITGLEFDIISAKEYVLLDSDNQVILPRFWQDTVKAGTNIILRTNPSDGSKESIYYFNHRNHLQIRQVRDERVEDTGKSKRLGFKKYLRKMQR